MAVLKDLIVHGPSRFINGINANSIKADEGIFNQLIAVDLKATDATIDNLTATNARVTQTLTANHISTNTWEAANIANVGGNFYISPTGEQSGSINVTIARTVVPGTDGGTYTLTFGVPSGSSGGFGVSSTSAAYWSASAKVMATGEVSYNNSKRYPLGTCSGTISSVTASNNNITAITIAGVKSEALDVLFTDMGIAITASNGTLSGCVGYKLKISLYERYSSTSGAYYPIGILLTSLGRNDKKQYIDIYGGSIKSGRNAADNANLDTGMAEPTLRIGELEGLPNIVDNGTSETKPTGWGIYTTNGFFKGKIVSNAGRIANWTITNSSIQTGNYNTSGAMYFGSSGISLGTTFRVTSAGVLTATSGTIGGYSLTANYLQSTDGTTGISVADNSTTASWAFWAGGTTTSTAKFRVDHNGVLYATGADITGAIKAQSFIAYDYYGSAYRTRAMIDTNGLTIYDGNGTAEGNIQARFGFTATIGKTSGNNYNIYIDGSAINLRYNKITLNKIDSSGMTLYDGNENNNTNIIANFGKTISLGKNGSSRIDLNINNFIFYDKNNSPYFKIGQESVSTQSLLESRTFIANDPNGHSVSYTLTTAEQSNYANGTLTILLSYDRREVINPDYSITGSTLKVSYFSLSDPNYDGDIIIETYGGTSNDTPYLTFGSRKGTIGATSIAMGYNCIASGARAFAIGVGTEASDTNAIAVGCDTTANNSSAFAEGTDTIASGLVSHAAGSGSQATAYACYAIGNTTLAGGYASFAAGEYTKAQSQAQFVIGRYNNNKSTNVFEIGWGDSDNIRENIFEVNTSGNVIDGSGTQLINKAMIDCGTTSGVTIGANSTAYIDVDFHKTFSSKPIVVCSIYSTSTAYTDIGKIRCWVTSVSTTGCRIYFYNQASSQRAPAAYWQAIAI